MTMYMPVDAVGRIDSVGHDYQSFCWSPPEQLRGSLVIRLRRVLADHPNTKEFSVHKLIAALQTDVASSALVLFSAAGVFEIPDCGRMSSHMMSTLGAGLALGRSHITIPRRLLRKKIPRNSLSILIQAIASVIDGAGSKVRQRWSWVFHPAMSVALGLTLFLLGIVSMTPIIGGGIQHAASAFLIGLGLAERDGLTVMIAAIAGMASVAYAVLSVVTGRKLWSRIKVWLIRCVRRLHLSFLAHLLDGIADGLGDLVRIRWGGLLLLLVTQAQPNAAQLERAAALGGRLKQRAQLAFAAPGGTGHPC